MLESLYVNRNQFYQTKTFRKSLRARVMGKYMIELISLICLINQTKSYLPSR